MRQRPRLVLVVARQEPGAIANWRLPQQTGGARVSHPHMRKAAATLAALAAAALTAGPASAEAPLPLHEYPRGSAFVGGGMWIWYLSQSSGGDLDRIAARARKAGVTTLFIKSSDGANVWRQFTKRRVAALHRRGLRVCGWGYVYGRRPTAEARAARTAIRRGADCFVIDAESEYEGKYAAADKYVRKLRSYAGRDYPIGVAPFPYVDYHPAYPYSVFLGPYGAQFNLPQMYHHDIGDSVPTVFKRTYSYGSLYARPILPLGQTYGGVPRRDIVRFRRYARAYAAGGTSWWSWQATTSRGWSAIAQPLDALPAEFRPRTAKTRTLGRGARGDFVVWAQQHLLSAGEKVKLNGVLDGRTVHALRSFQQENDLPVNGRLDHATWSELLTLEPRKVRWGRSGARYKSGVTPPPRSASLPPVRNEISPGPRR